jgi:hypothetical protein
MKTTLTIRDDVIRRAKARAALVGKPLSRYVEESLTRTLEEDAPESQSWNEWILGLPEVPHAAVVELRETLNAEDFRTIDPEMWR